MHHLAGPLPTHSARLACFGSTDTLAVREIAMPRPGEYAAPQPVPVAVPVHGQPAMTQPLVAQQTTAYCPVNMRESFRTAAASFSLYVRSIGEATVAPISELRSNSCRLRLLTWLTTPVRTQSRRYLKQLPGSTTISMVWICSKHVLRDVLLGAKQLGQWGRGWSARSGCTPVEMDTSCHALGRTRNSECSFHS